MTQRKAHRGQDFGALRHAIERCDPDLILGFYSEEANLSIVNADVPQASAFELSGKAEIAKHLRAAFGREASHRVERAATVGEDRVKFWETSEYPHDGKIVRQVDVVKKTATLDRKEEISRGSPFRTFYP